MQYTSKTDNTVYEDFSTRSGNSLVVMKSEVYGLQEIYQAITESLNRWYQPFHLEYSDGVVIIFENSPYFLKNIEYNSEKRAYILTCFGTDKPFVIPIGRDIRFINEISNITYVSADATSFFAPEPLKVSELPVRLIEYNGGHTIQCGVIDIAADFYSCSDKYIEIAKNGRHYVFSPRDIQFNEHMMQLPEQFSARLSEEGQRIYLADKNEAYLLHAFTDGKILVSSVENNDYKFYLEDIL